MAWVDKKEKWFRLLVFGVQIFLGIIPWAVYIRKETGMCSKVGAIIVGVSSLIGAIYAAFCIYTKGFVRENLDDLNIPQEYVRQCHLCAKPKPERSHHCKICQKCVLKMDHHCNILAVCINNKNHGHFIRFLLFTWISAGWLLLYNFALAGHKIFGSSNRISYFMSGFIVFVTFVAFCTVVITSMHLYWQLSNLRRNITNIEAVQEHNSKYRNIDCGPAPYNYGFLNNCRSVLGPAKFLFLGPCMRSGYKWKKRYTTFYWPLLDASSIRTACDEQI